MQSMPITTDVVSSDLDQGEVLYTSKYVLAMVLAVLQITAYEYDYPFGVLFCLTVFNATFNNFLMNVGVPEG
jgi:hypothetical protein